MGEAGEHLIDTVPSAGPRSSGCDLGVRMREEEPDELYPGVSARAENGDLDGFHGEGFGMAGKSRLANAE